MVLQEYPFPLLSVSGLDPFRGAQNFRLLPAMLEAFAGVEAMLRKFACVNAWEKNITSWTSKQTTGLLFAITPVVAVLRALAVPVPPAVRVAAEYDFQ
jgi:hypothetical protein